MNSKPGLRTLKKLSWALAASSLLSAAAYADVGGVPQASLNLQGSSMSYCHTVKNTWDVSKSVDQDTVNSGSSVVWTVTATKNDGGPPPNSTFCVEGTLVIWNSGGASATIGNIIVNAQKQRVISGKQRWVSASVDVADKTNRDLATQGLIVAAASQENQSWNTAAGVNNYTVTNGIGTFTENAASGSIEFADGDWNDALANNAYVIGPNQTVSLNYKATFDGTVLGLNPAGDHVRTEVLVTFGNAGGRGGSGASVDGGTDIDGSGGLTDDETHVRTVPIRASLDVPALEQCNPTVTLSDVMVGNGTTFEITQSDFDSNGNATPSTTTTYHMTTTLTGAGAVTNTVSLDGTETACCDAAHDEASATVTVTDICLPGDPRPQCCAGPSCNCQCGFNEETQRCNVCQGPLCTLTQGAYNINANGIGAQQMGYFPTTFASGLQLGDKGACGADDPACVGLLNAGPPVSYGDGSANGYSVTWTNSSVGINALRSFIGGGSGKASALAGDFTNPSTLAGRQVISQVLALTLNVGFSSAGVMINGSGFGSTQLGNVMFCKGGAPCSTPISILDYLDIANRVISGQSVSGWSMTDVGNIAAGFNQGYDECQAGDGFTQSHVVTQ